MGLSQSRQRAESVALQQGTVPSPTHSAASSVLDHSPHSSPDSEPKSPPSSPTALALPDTASTYLLAEKHPDSGSSSDDDSLENGLEPKDLIADLNTDLRPKLTYGLMIKALLKSLPQALALPAAAGFWGSGLIAPIVFNKLNIKMIQENENHALDYLFYSALASLLLSTICIAYDTHARLKNYLNGTHYDSAGIFRLRALFTGAALGSVLTKNVLARAGSKNLVTNFILTLLFTSIPAYLRYRNFNHDMIPAPLDPNVQAVKNSSEKETQKGFLKNHGFRVLAALFIAASSGLLLYRALGTLSIRVSEDYQAPNLATTLSAAIPGVIGASFSFFMPSAPHAHRRWKQLEILLGETAMIYLATTDYFFSFPRKFEEPSAFLNRFSFCMSLLFGAVQASRLMPIESPVQACAAPRSPRSS